jgi:hypothetical protein
MKPKRKVHRAGVQNYLILHFLVSGYLSLKKWSSNVVAIDEDIIQKAGAQGSITDG